MFEAAIQGILLLFQPTVFPFLLLGLGVSLIFGILPEKYQRQAELGERGEFNQVAQELMSGGRKV